MQPLEEAFVPAHGPSARMRDRTIDVDSVELEVIDAEPRGARRWIGGGTLLVASVSFVVGTAAFFALDETLLRASGAPPLLPTSPAPSAPSLPSLAAPRSESGAVAPEPVEQVAAVEPIAPAQEVKAAPASEAAQEAKKPVRKRSRSKRTRTLTSTSSRAVTKRVHRQ